MSTTWYGDDPPPPLPPIGLAGWLRVALRSGMLLSVICAGLVCLAMLRLVERPLFAAHRPLSPYVTVFVCRASLMILGLPVRRVGPLARDAGALVANHASWLDIFVLNAGGPLCFVSKADVAGWPGIGFLARATGTVFIERSRSKAGEQARLFGARLEDGQVLVFFPEGTSSDGLRVLPFKSTLFAAFFGDSLRDRMQVQPVSIAYAAPHMAEARFYGWWGDMDFGPHLLAVLAASGQGRVDITYHPPFAVTSFSNRKDLAAACEKAVRDSHSALMGHDASQGL